ncbi:endonuclease/exonuclease/phosphatase family protein [Alkalilacustris brevis]|uniref:endonuclease/exonuclease/phosphatase family protein n=1 Tax=Alkalilacustris brevis TaxID=2026338 RepID=UPI00192E5780|nr:endonuclease/exonuclease/phosphatase family protein [Alkalilacustris brevis]
MATFNANLSRSGPGLLLRDILSGQDEQIEAVAQIIAAAKPDILLLTKFDYDHGGVALKAFAQALAAWGVAYPYRFALRPNSGVRTGLDMTGDGREDTPDDTQGYGTFAGQGGMALLSHHPVDAQGVRDFSEFLWRDLPGALLPRRDGALFPSEEVFAIQRLSTTGHWDVPVLLPGGQWLHLLAFYASPPVFGGLEGRNLRRNHDEVRFWNLLLSDALPMPPPDAPFVLLGDANLDPFDGDGKHAAIRALLAHPALQDPAPRSAGGAAMADAPVNEGHRGEAPLDTTHWPQARGPGNLRVDYVLPAAGLTLRGAGVFWPAPEDPEAPLLRTRSGEEASRHRLVWVDLALPLH